LIHITELTSKSTGAGGGGKVDLSTFRLVAFSLPVFVLAFLPMMINKGYHPYAPESQNILNESDIC
jgi:hypothetical protein